MQNLKKIALGTFIASAGLIVANAPAQAALIGDTVTLNYNNGAIIDSATVVDPGIEFVNITSSGTFQRSVDIFAESFDAIYFYNNAGSASFGSSTYLLSDLDWLPTPGIVTGVTQTAGITTTSISFTDNSITIELPSFNVSNFQTETFSFDIETQKETTPEPSAMLGLLTLAGLGLGSRFKGNNG